MAEGNDIGSGVAMSLMDNRVDLNVAAGTMDVVKSSQSLNVGGVQPTTRSTVSDILKHETTLSYVSIAPSTTRGTVLYQTPIDPSAFNSAGSPSRVSWLSRLYRFWRGDVKFKFVFTKTILQQTKILAIFVPGAGPNDPAPTPDRAFFYSHKVLMNPANETDWSLDVPFVSDKPFRLMGEPTGMFYVLLFQNMVVSSADASDIYFSMFISGISLDFHEFVQLPAIAAQSMIMPSDAYIIETYLGATNTATPVGNRTFLSDSGATLATTTGNDAFVAPAMIPNGTPIGASVLVPSSVLYNANTMRTIAGTPFGQCSSQRTVEFVQTTVPDAAAVGLCAFLTVYVWSDLSYAIGPAQIVATTKVTAPQMAAYGAIFPSTFTRDMGGTEELQGKVRALENALTALLRRVGEIN